MINKIKNSYEYKLISEFYGDNCASRSKVPLMNHINEGISIMIENDASKEAILAYCIHPIIQGDKEFVENIDMIAAKVEEGFIHPIVMAYALEYRKIANSYLCKPYTDRWDKDDLNHIIGYIHEPVRQMLIADKIQNKKDFLIYHLDTHARSEQLNKYFNNWLEYLKKV